MDSTEQLNKRLVSISSTFTLASFIRKRNAQLFSSYVWLCNFLAKGYRQKRARKMLMKMSPEIVNGLGFSSFIKIFGFSHRI